MKKNIVKNNFAKTSAFTLAEVMIVLVVLGVIASLTIPSLINKQQESANRTKLKKALSSYEAVINKIVIGNNLKSDGDVDDFAAADCKNTSTYFKISKKIDDNCVFRTPDGLYWNISNIRKPVVSFNKDNVQNTSLALDDSEKTTFGFVAYFDEKGSLRLDDYPMSTGDDKTALKKLYTYLKYNLGKAGDCSCTGDNCCNTSCPGEHVCVQKNVSCITDSYVPNNVPVAAIRPNPTDACKAERYFYSDGISYTVQRDDNKIAITLDNDYASHHNYYWATVNLIKNPDGTTVLYQYDTPGTGDFINQMTIDKDGKILSLYNYDRKGDYKTSPLIGSTIEDDLGVIHVEGGKWTMLDKGTDGSQLRAKLLKEMLSTMK